MPEGRRIFGELTVEENLRAGPRGSLLSGGEQQMLAIGRELMSEPKLLLLDEPSLGLAPQVVERIGEVIGEINEQGTSVILVEQNANPLVEGRVDAQAEANGVPRDRVLEDMILAPHAVKRLIEPEEVAETVAFLVVPGGRVHGSGGSRWTSAGPRGSRPRGRPLPPLPRQSWIGTGDRWSIGIAWRRCYGIAARFG